MTENTEYAEACDAELVAYLDDALAPDQRRALEERLASDRTLKARLEVLRRGNRPFRPAFDELLAAAPVERLETMLAAAQARAAEAKPKPTSMRRPAAMAIAACLATLIIGLASGYGLHGLHSRHAAPEVASDEAWEGMMAGSISLYTPESLGLIAAKEQPSDAELAAIGARLGVALDTARLAVPGLQLKQARLLAYEGKPFAQLIYLDPRHGPVAFCIYHSDEREALSSESRGEGLNLIYWNTRPTGYMLIGKAPLPDLGRYAHRLKQAFPS